MKTILSTVVAFTSTFIASFIVLTVLTTDFLSLWPSSHNYWIGILCSCAALTLIVCLISYCFTFFTKVSPPSLPESTTQQLFPTIDSLIDFTEFNRRRYFIEQEAQKNAGIPSNLLKNTWDIESQRLIELELRRMELQTYPPLIVPITHINDRLTVDPKNKNNQIVEMEKID